MRVPYNDGGTHSYSHLRGMTLDPKTSVYRYQKRDRMNRCIHVDYRQVYIIYNWANLANVWRHAGIVVFVLAGVAFSR